MKTTLMYTLQDRTPVAEPNASAWQAWMMAAQKDGSRIVSQTRIDAHISVSTVFAGMGQGPAGSPGIDRPMVFESAVFEDGQVRETYVYATWDEAQSGHAALITALNAEA